MVSGTNTALPINTITKGPLFDSIPPVGFALLNFDYSLNGTPGLSASRSFAKAAPQLGLKSEWIPGGPFSLSAGVLEFAAIFNPTVTAVC